MIVKRAVQKDCLFSIILYEHMRTYRKVNRAFINIHILHVYFSFGSNLS